MFKRIICGFPVVAVLLSMQAHAATYYVRNGGDDSADGRSHATAWATIDKVNSFSFSSGDVVLFHEGHTWKSKRLEIDWGGTSSARAVVGAYYLENGAPRPGYRTARPTFDGEDRFPTRYEALVLVTAPYVRLENIALINSEGRGVTVNKANWFHATGLYIHDTYDCGLVLIESDDGLIENNHVLETNTEKPEDNLNWCAGLMTVRSDRGVFRRNLVERSYGEGINTNYGSTDTIIEDNRVFGVRAVGIYADSAPNTTIRRNIVVGTLDRNYWRYSDAVGPGIVLCNEPYSHHEGGGNLDASVQSRNAKVYGNLIAYTKYGLAFWGGLSSNRFENTQIYNNTFIDNGAQFRTIGHPMPNSVFANNILLSVSSDTEDVLGTASGLETQNNYYSQGDPGGIYTHSGNKYSGLQLHKMTGWRSIDSIEDFSAADFAPAGISSTNGVGTDAHIQSTAGKDAYHLDFNSEPHNKPIDLGGIRSGGGTAAVKKPKGPQLIGAQPH